MASQAATGKATGEATGKATGEATIAADREARLLEFCADERTKAEMMAFCGLSPKSADYFRKQILNPLIESGRLKRTIPDKPTSPNQKYIRA